MNATKHQHIAHQLGLARIRYRFHPLFDRVVQVIRNLRTREAPGVIVQDEADLRLMVPCWMLDEGCCQTVEVEKKARIAVDALLELQALLDSQGMFSGSEDAGYDSIMANGKCHESTTKTLPIDDCRAPRDA